MKKSFYRRVLSYFANHKSLFCLSVITAVFASGLQLLLPYLMGVIIDFIPAKGQVNMAQVGKYCCIMVVSIVLAALFQWFVSFTGTKIAYQVSSDLRKQAFSKLNSYPVSYFDRVPHGDVVSRITSDVENISDGVLQVIRQLFTGIVSLVGSLVLMFRLNWAVTLVVVGLTPLAFLLSSFIVRNSNKMFTKQQQVLGEMNGFAREYIDSQKTVRAAGMEDSSETRFSKSNDLLYTYGQKAQFFSSLVNPSTRLVNSTIYITVGVVGGVLACFSVKLGGVAISVGLIASFLAYALQFARPINDITNVTTGVQTALVSFRRVFELLDEPVEPTEPSDTPKLQVFGGEIKFKGVSFSYTDTPLIENLSLHIPAGSKVAVVGPTGAGKTTLVNLLMRFYDVSSGTITVDGQDTAKVTKDSLRQNFAMVLQDTFIFTGTVRENIAYGTPRATEEQVVSAAKEAYAHSFIKRLPQGYDTVITAGGSGLSNGQRQLLTIARAILADSPVLILDEATSSVDTLTEVRIAKAFKNMAQGKTTFVIAHRLSTIVDSDLILVMDKGRVVQHGTHSKLLSSGGLYAELYNSQFER